MKEMKDEKKSNVPFEGEEDIEALRADAMRYREQMKQKEQFDKRVKEIQAQWDKDVKALKGIIPDFDFAKAMQNRDFHDRIMGGEAIPLAYLAVNNMAMSTPVNQRRVITQNGQSTANANGSPEMNVEGMSEEDFSKYLNKLKNR